MGQALAVLSSRGPRDLGRSCWELKINPKATQGGTEIYLIFHFRKEHRKKRYKVFEYFL
jgi:hypothetical protein